MDRGRPIQFTGQLANQITPAPPHCPVITPGVLCRWRLCTVLVILLAGLTPRPAGAATHSLRLPVLVMHHVKWDRPGDDAIELGLTIHPSQFRQEVRYLASHRYRTVSAAGVAGVLVRGGKLPSHSVALTFDDGYADMYTNVYPVLRSHHMTATFFVCPGLIGKPRYMTWKQVQTMVSHGMDIEAHTMTHPDLTRVSAAQAWGEINGSRQALRSRVHVPARVFAYPYGTSNATVLGDVRKAGYWIAFTTQQGWVLKSGSRFLLPRVYIDRDDSLAQFAARLTDNLAVVSQDPT